MARLRDFMPAAMPRQEAIPEPAAFSLPGDEGELYDIGVLARALNRSTSRVREWERLGVIPPAYVVNPGSKQGQRRRYTREQVLGLRQLAAETGILDNPRASLEEFRQYAHLLFASLKERSA